MVARNALLGLVLAGVAAASVACSDAPDSAKKPLPVCDANDVNCPGVPATSAPKKPHTEIPTDPVPAPVTQRPQEDDPASATPDAGVDAAPVLGAFCKKLSTCCDQLGEAGYITTTCKSVLSTNNEDACYTQHATYKSAGDCS
jgi:hypothetical protein